MMQEKGCAGFVRHVKDVHSVEKLVSANCYLKLNLPVFLKYFLIVPKFSLVLVIDMFLIKKRVPLNTRKLNHI